MSQVRAALALAACLVLVCGQVAAQESDPGTVPDSAGTEAGTGLTTPGTTRMEVPDIPGATFTRVVTIDPDRLFAETLFGRRVLSVLEARAAVVATENRRIEAELVEEERALTERRPDLAVEEFRALADDFNRKVEEIRADREARTRELQRLRETEQQRFFGLIGPALSRLLEDREAAIVLDRRGVFLALDSADITDAAIAAIDADIGDGGTSGEDRFPD